MAQGFLKKHWYLYICVCRFQEIWVWSLSVIKWFFWFEFSVCIIE
jgi:hypothetical protein